MIGKKQKGRHCMNLKMNTRRSSVEYKITAVPPTRIQQRSQMRLRSTSLNSQRASVKEEASSAAAMSKLQSHKPVCQPQKRSAAANNHRGVFIMPPASPPPGPAAGHENAPHDPPLLPEATFPPRE